MASRHSHVQTVEGEIRQQQVLYPELHGPLIGATAPHLLVAGHLLPSLSSLANAGRVIETTTATAASPANTSQTREQEKGRIAMLRECGCTDLIVA